MTEENLEEVNALGCKVGKGLLVALNFALGAVLMMRFAQEGRSIFPDVGNYWLHHDRKVDAPSGTALKTAEMIAVGRSGSGPTAKPVPLGRSTVLGGEYLGEDP